MFVNYAHAHKKDMKKLKSWRWCHWVVTSQCIRGFRYCCIDFFSFSAHFVCLFSIFVLHCVVRPLVLQFHYVNKLVCYRSVGISDLVECMQNSSHIIICTPHHTPKLLADWLLKILYVRNVVEYKLPNCYECVWVIASIIYTFTWLWRHIGCYKYQICNDDPCKKYFFPFCKKWNIDFFDRLHIAVAISIFCYLKICA